MKRIADSGLLIAALDAGDAHHPWAKHILQREPPPWLVCESVLAETSASIGTPQPVLEMLEAGDLELAFSLTENQSQVLALIKKYRDQPMDLADACVVRMSELFDDAVVYTLDVSDFLTYRRHGRQAIPCVFPK